MQRHGEAKDRPTSVAVLRPDLAPVRLDDRPRYGQPEAGAVRFGRKKRIENLLELVSGDTSSRIAHRYLCAGSRKQRSLNHDRALRGNGIRHCIHTVAGEVHYHLLQMNWVGPHWESLLTAIHAQPNISPPGLGRKNVHGIRNDFVQVKLLHLELALALYQRSEVLHDFDRVLVGLAYVAKDLPQLADFGCTCLQ